MPKMAPARLSASRIRLTASDPSGKSELEKAFDKLLGNRKEPTTKKAKRK